MGKTYRIFGYGSLLNEDSLRKTIPNASNIFPAYIFGYVRVFNVESPYRFCKGKNCYASVLNLEPSDPQIKLNGICFDMPEDHFKELLVREEKYELVEVDTYDYNDSTKIVKASFFREPVDEHYPYQFGEPEQEEYLEMCLEGCKKYGQEYVELFKETTFIDGKSVKERDY